MDEINAINILQSKLFDASPAWWLKDLEESCDIAIRALKKQLPQKPIEDGYYDEPCVCPNCGNPIVNDADVDYAVKYCYHCGQKIDWSKTSNETD